MMKNGYTIQAKAAKKIIDAAAEDGVAPDDLYRAVQFDPTSLSNPDSRIPYAQLVALYEAAAGLTGDHAFGLHVAERATPGMFDVLGYAGMHSPNVGEALRRGARYFSIWNDGAVVNLEIQLTRALLRYRIVDSSVKEWRHEVESSLAIIVCGSRLVSGVDWMPIEVAFRHVEPKDISEHKRIFGPSIQFEAAENLLVFDREVLDLPLPEADPNLCALLDRHAEELLAKAPRTGGIVERVRTAMGEALRGGDPSFGTISKQLGMSARTLQRRLKEQRVAYHELLDEMRRELAMRYLQESELAICEVAYLLGFSDATAFHRAFRRWTGATPGEYRRARPHER
jgi:AraC-like DNA-binding protein